MTEATKPEALRLAEYLEQFGPSCNISLAVHEAAAELRRLHAESERAVPAAWTNLLAYVLQDDMHNRLTPRVVDIAYTAFTLAKRPNTEDGGASDWFNDTKPKVAELIAKLRKDLAEELAAPPEVAKGEVSADIDRDDDGDLLIDWSPAVGRMMTLSLRADGLLSYAIRWDGDTTHGTAQMPASVTTSQLAAQPVNQVLLDASKETVAAWDAYWGGGKAESDAIEFVLRTNHLRAAIAQAQVQPEVEQRGALTDDPLQGAVDWLLQADGALLCVANVQRTLRIGYNRAKRLCDTAKERAHGITKKAQS